MRPQHRSLQPQFWLSSGPNRCRLRRCASHDDVNEIDMVSSNFDCMRRKLHAIARVCAGLKTSKAWKLIDWNQTNLHKVMHLFVCFSFRLKIIPCRTLDKWETVLCRHETCVCGEAIKCTCINWHIISTRMSCLWFFLCRFRVVKLKSYQQNSFF